MAVAIIRLRGIHNIKPQIKDTLKYLRLNQVNHAVVLPDNETTKGMLQSAKDYVTWGHVDADTLAETIRTRGQLTGHRVITDEHVAANTDFADINAMAAAIVAGEYLYKHLAEVKPLFRLHPARKGLEGIKRSVQNGGALGPRGEKINDLIRRMM
jgi:large subunit ribosomal protein L30